VWGEVNDGWDDDSIDDLKEGSGKKDEEAMELAWRCLIQNDTSSRL